MLKEQELVNLSVVGPLIGNLRALSYTPGKSSSRLRFASQSKSQSASFSDIEYDPRAVLDQLGLGLGLELALKLGLSKIERNKKVQQ